jgi:hypothetical protein
MGSVFDNIHAWIFYPAKKLCVHIPGIIMVLANPICYILLVGKVEWMECQTY